MNDAARPLVYVVVLNHNGERWLKRCLESLLGSRYDRLRVLLVDNASTDTSVALARSLSPQIEILHNSANLGFSAGNNAGIDFALQRGADYVALLNNDTWVEPDWLARIVEVGGANPALGILGPVHLVFDGDDFNNWMTAAYPNLLETFRQRDQPGAFLPVEWIEGSALVVKRHVFESIGRLDPIFFAYFEECDFCRRARAAGFQVAIVPSAKIHHYRGGSFNQPPFAPQRAVLLQLSSMLFNSSDPAASLLSNLKGLVHNDAVHLKNALFGDGRLAVWCRANWEALPRLPALYRKWRADRSTLRAIRVMTPGS